MYLDGLEIAGLGAGMVFLALVVMLASTLVLRLLIDKLDRLRAARIPPAPPPTPVEEPPASFSPATAVESAQPTPEAGSPAPRDKAARAAAIAVALYFTEEEEAEGRTDR